MRQRAAVHATRYVPRSAATKGDTSAVVSNPSPFMSVAQKPTPGDPPATRNDTNAVMSSPSTKPSAFTSPPPAANKLSEVVDCTDPQIESPLAVKVKLMDPARASALLG